MECLLVRLHRETEFLVEGVRNMRIVGILCIVFRVFDGRNVGWMESVVGGVLC